jgi:hypothetical protein
MFDNDYEEFVNNYDCDVSTLMNSINKHV